MSNNVKSRIQMKADTAANWTTAGNNGFTPLKNEAIFYTDKNNMKLGDGVTNVNNLDFFFKGAEGAMQYMGEINSAPTWLTEQQKGYVYKANFTFAPDAVIINTPIYGDMGSSSDGDRFMLPNNIPSQGYFYINYTGNIQDISCTLYYTQDDIDWEGNPTTIEWPVDVEESGWYSTTPEIMDLYLGSSGWDYENDGFAYDTFIQSVVFSSTPIPKGLIGKEIHPGDLMIWTGSAWDIIPSGNDILDTTELKNEIIQEMEDYIDNSILNGAW